MFIATSAISGVNRDAAAGPVAVPAYVAELLADCQRVHRDTDGAFDVTTTPLSRCWGFLRREGRVPRLEAIEDARRQVGFGAVHVSSDPPSVTLQPSRDRAEPRRRRQGLRAGSRSARCCARRACSTRCCRPAAAASSLWVVAATAGWSTSSRLSGPGGPSRRSRCGTRRLARAAPASSSSSRTGDATVTSSIRGPAGRRTASSPRASSPRTPRAPTRCRPRSSSAGSIWPRRYCSEHPDVLALITPDDGSERTIVVGSHPAARLVSD